MSGEPNSGRSKRLLSGRDSFASFLSPSWGALVTMTSKLKCPPTGEQMSILEEERNLMRAFKALADASLAGSPAQASDANLQALIAASSIMVPVFSETGEPLIRREPETFEEKLMPRVLSRKRPVLTDEERGSAATVSGSEFTERFGTYCHHLLDGMDWTDLFVAGGSVIASLLPGEATEWTHADVDIYVLSMDEGRANQLTHYILGVIRENVNKIAQNNKERVVEVVRTKRTVSIETVWKVFQVVTTLFESPMEILIGFDVDAGCVGTNDGGKTAITTKRGKLALSRRYNLYMLDYRPTLMVDGRYQKRLMKYSKKGFAVLVPNEDWSNLPDLSQHFIPDKLRGTALLAFYDRMDALAPNRSSYNHFFVSGIEQCIHGGDSWCKRCHKELPQIDADPKSRLSFAEPLIWNRSNLSRQDFESGQQIRVVPGAVPVPADFEENVYLSNPEPSSDDKSPQDQQSFTTKISSASDTKPSNADAETAKFAFSPLSETAGLTVPICYCGQSCSLKAVKREGPNFKRRFFCCRNSQNERSCDFFQWEDSTSTFLEQQAEKFRESHAEETLAQALESLTLDSSKKLLALSSCFKSGRLTAPQRNAIKDALVTPVSDISQESTLFIASMNKAFNSFASHGNLEQLSADLIVALQSRQ